MPTPLQVRRRIIRCTRCELSGRPGVRPVPYRGDPRSLIAIMGEAPGDTENQQGKPFVGASGRLLTKLFEEVSGLEGYLDQAFVFNTVSCYPGGTPEPEHEHACRIHVKRQLELWQGRYLLVLGNVALHYFEPDAKILSVRGDWWLRGDRLIFPTVHPSYTLRSPQGRDLLEKDIARFTHLVATGQ